MKIIQLVMRNVKVVANKRIVRYQLSTIKNSAILALQMQDKRQRDNGSGEAPRTTTALVPLPKRNSTMPNTLVAILAARQNQRRKARRIK
jgi:hypothetical protein